jgi:hypothetical protein
MAVFLTKVVNDRAVVIDTLLNQQTVKAWLGKAQTAMRESHKKRHDAATLKLRW